MKSGLWTLAVAAVLAALCSCTGPAQAGPAAHVQLENPARRDGKQPIAFLAPASEEVVPLLKALRQEVSEDFDVVVLPIKPGADEAARVGAELLKLNPRVVVLVNNPTVALYRQWAQGRAADTLPAAVILMSAFSDELQKGVPNSTGISYEVPGVSAVVSLRAALGSNVERVGVVHRRRFRAFVQHQRDLASIEQIQFVAEEVSDEPTGIEVRKALRTLKRRGVDALWLLNDNRLLTPDTLNVAWLPYTQAAQVPVIVGVPGLVRADSAFGTFAVIPDPAALGVQAANLIYELSEKGFKATGTIQQPVSVKTFLDLERARGFGFTDDRAKEVDVVVK